MNNVGAEIEPVVPSDLLEALATVPVAEAAWHDLTTISRMDFIRWIETAKQADTRKRRIRIACEKLVAGERRPCCYAVVPMDLYKALGAHPEAKSQWSKLSPTERRAFVSWVDDSEGREDRKARVEEVIARVAAGDRVAP